MIVHDNPLLRAAVEQERARNKHRAQLVAGIDLAFVRDGSALVVTDQRLEKLVVVEHDFRVPLPGQPLDPIAVCDEYLDRVAALGCSHVVADEHYREVLRGACVKRSLTLHSAPSSGRERDKSWITTRHYARARTLAIPKQVADHLAKIESAPKPGGGLVITAKRSL